MAGLPQDLMNSLVFPASQPGPTHQSAVTWRPETDPCSETLVDLDLEEEFKHKTSASSPIARMAAVPTVQMQSSDTFLSASQGPAFQPDDLYSRVANLNQTNQAVSSSPTLIVQYDDDNAIMSLDQWEEQTRKEAEKHVASPQWIPATKRKASAPGASTLQPVPAPAGCPSMIQPIPISKPRSTQHMKKLHEDCQAKGLVPEFEFCEVPSKTGKSMGFGVKLHVAGETVVDMGPFASKKEAKEAVAAEGLRVVERLNVPDRKKKSPHTAEKKVNKEVDRQENWVGLLLEFTNATDHPAPMYQEFAAGLQFGCEVTLPGLREEEPLSSRMVLFTSKKLAKANAAREAVLWLRDQGIMSSTPGSIKKKRKDITRESAAFGATDERGRMVVENDGLSHERSFRQQVDDLCRNVGIIPPTYRLMPNSTDPNYSTCAAFFPQDPLITGPIGNVNNQLGKKTAKEECARLVLEFLHKEIERREHKILVPVREKGNAFEHASTAEVQEGPKTFDSDAAESIHGVLRGRPSAADFF